MEIDQKKVISNVKEVQEVLFQSDLNPREVLDSLCILLGTGLAAQKDAMGEDLMEESIKLVKYIFNTTGRKKDG